MESLKGGISFKVNFIDSGYNPRTSSVKSRCLIVIYNGDWRLEEDGDVNASMTITRRVGTVRSHNNLIEKVHGIGAREALVSISECLGIEGKKVELDGRLLNDPMSYGGISFSCKAIPTELYVPDNFEDNQKVEVVRIALRVGAVALHCSGLPLEELKKSPVKHFSSDEVDKLVHIFHSNVHFGKEWGEYKKIAKDL